MDLEQAKAIWEREKQEFLSEMPIRERAADIMRKAEGIEKKIKADQKKQLLWGIVCLVLLASRYNPSLPLLSNIGLGILVLFAGIGLASNYVFSRRLRDSRLALPRKEYLTEQKKSVMGLVKIMRLNMVFVLPCGLTGALLWQWGQSHSKAAIILIACLVAIALICGLIAITWKIRKKLMPAIKEIDQELDQMT
jgi:uncharacterized membrane protein YqjE